MYKNIIKKCLDELAKDKPNTDYIRGMLESVYETMEPAKPMVPAPMPMPNMPNITPPFIPTVSVEDKAEFDALAAEAETARMSGLIEKDLRTESHISLNSGRTKQ